MPTLERKCVDLTKEPFPNQFATALFSFLSHLARFDTDGDALVKYECRKEQPFTIPIKKQQCVERNHQDEMSPLSPQAPGGEEEEEQQQNEIEMSTILTPEEEAST